MCLAWLTILALEISRRECDRIAFGYKRARHMATDSGARSEDQDDLRERQIVFQVCQR
jgi:hypothetical protein